MSVRKALGLICLTLLFSGSMFLAFRFHQQQVISRCDINEDGIVNNQDYLEMFHQDNPSEFAEIYSRATHDPTGDEVWDEEDKMVIINAWQTKEGEERYDPRADLFPDGMINEIDMDMARVAEKSQNQLLGIPLECMYDLVRRIGWARRFEK